MCVDESCRLRWSSGEMGKGRHRTPLGASPRDRVRLRERGRVCGCACACWSAGACACVFEGSRSVLLQSQSSRFSSPPVLLPESHTPLCPHAWPSCLLPAGAPGRVQVPGKADGVPRRRSETVWGSFVVAREGCFSTYVAHSLHKTKKTFMCLCST